MTDDYDRMSPGRAVFIRSEETSQLSMHAQDVEIITRDKRSPDSLGLPIAIQQAICIKIENTQPAEDIITIGKR
jgi:hypothetical protein